MNFNKKTKIFILISALALSLPLFFYRITSVNIRNINTNTTHLNRAIANEINNESEVVRYIKYKKKFGSETGGVREEPVSLTATFASYRDFKKMEDIIYNIYHKEGGFFLSSFSLTGHDKDSKKKSRGITMTIKGKKVVLFW